MLRQVGGAIIPRPEGLPPRQTSGCQLAGSPIWTASTLSTTRSSAPVRQRSREVNGRGGSKVAGGVYETELDRNDADFVPLSPLTFLERAASVRPDRTAIVHGEIRRSSAETFSRVRRLGSRAARLWSRRHGRSACEQHAGAVRGPFRRAARRRGAERHQHPARCPCHRFILEHRESRVVDRGS